MNTGSPTCHTISNTPNSHNKSSNIGQFGKSENHVSTPTNLISNLSCSSAGGNLPGRHLGLTSLPGSTSITLSDTGTSLERIVTEYLTSQHALCRNPVVTCPTFDLFQ